MFDDSTSYIIAGLAAFTALVIAIIQVGGASAAAGWVGSVGQCPAWRSHAASNHPPRLGCPQIIQHLRHYSEPVFQVRTGMDGALCAYNSYYLLPSGRLHALAPAPLAALTPTPTCRPQRYIVRIIFMIPVYSMASFPSLLAPENAIYWLTLRDWCAEQHAAGPGGLPGWWLLPAELYLIDGFIAFIREYIG